MKNSRSSRKVNRSKSLATAAGNMADQAPRIAALEALILAQGESQTVMHNLIVTQEKTLAAREQTLASMQREMQSATRAITATAKLMASTLRMFRERGLLDEDREAEFWAALGMIQSELDEEARPVFADMVSRFRSASVHMIVPPASAQH